MRSLFTRTSGGRALVEIGVGVLLIELTKYWVHDHPIHAWPVVIAALFLSVGFYLLDPRTARDGITVITDSAAKIIVAVRSGRRTTDATTLVVEPRETAPPDDGDGA